jgi:hypothetical protein
MTTPQGGEYWFTGDQINIRWERTTGDSVEIELFKGADLAGMITPSTLNNGFYPWLSSITFGQGSGEDYSIKVTHLKESDCSAQTELFELIDISNCYIKFPWTMKDSIPDLTAGREFLISWASEHTSGNVDLELWDEPFLQQGVLVGVIAQDLPDTGSYMWTVDSFHHGTDMGFRFKIRDVDAHRCGDTSVPFKIIDEDNCSIDVLGINGGYEYPQDEILPISFALENSSGVVDLKLYSGNIPVTGGTIIEGFDTQNGTVIYNWVVTDYGHGGPAYDRFNIRAWDSSDEYCVGQSVYFAIAQ